MNSNVDWSKPIQTRDGKKSELLCKEWNGPGGRTRLVKVTDKRGQTFSRACLENGRLFPTYRSQDDIVNAAPPSLDPKQPLWLIRKDERPRPVKLVHIFRQPNPWLLLGVYDNGVREYSLRVKSDGSTLIGSETVINVPEGTMVPGLLSREEQAAAYLAIAGCGVPMPCLTTAPDAREVLGSIYRRDVRPNLKVDPKVDPVKFQVKTRTIEATEFDWSGPLYIFSANQWHRVRMFEFQWKNPATGHRGVRIEFGEGLNARSMERAFDKDGRSVAYSEIRFGHANHRIDYIDSEGKEVLGHPIVYEPGLSFHESAARNTIPGGIKFVLGISSI